MCCNKTNSPRDDDAGGEIGFYGGCISHCVHSRLQSVDPRVPGRSSRRFLGSRRLVRGFRDKVSKKLVATFLTQACQTEESVAKFLLLDVAVCHGEIGIGVSLTTKVIATGRSATVTKSG